MKFLILSLGTGGGHNTAANAVKQALIERGDEAQVFDCLAIVSPFRSRLVCGTYLGIVRYTPKLFGVIYSLSFRVASHRRKSVVYAVNVQNAGRLADFINKEKPDGVITTHIFGAQQLTYVKRHNLTDVWMGGVVTDYDVQPFWNETELDTVFVPEESFIDGYAEKGMRRDTIVATGIPVDPSLSEVTDKRQAKLDAGLDPDQRCVVIAGGSMGAGHMPGAVAALLRDLPRDVRIVAVCGSNQRLMRRLSRLCRDPRRLQVMGFVKPLHRLIRAADIVISKPGGLTSTETFVQRVPLVAVHPIEGVESNNAGYMARNGIAACPETDEDLSAIVNRMLSDPSVSETMLQNQRRLIPKNASRHIADYAAQIVSNRRA
ncbi:MAG: glycosyltransferase [Clostridia bacterium]|nr:glycosyltransferase [Clostridia bacterium]